MHITLARIAELTGGRLVGNGERAVRRVRPVDDAGPEDLCFVANDKAQAALAESGAGAVIVAEGRDALGRDAVFHANPLAAIASVIAVLYPDTAAEPGVHATAVVHPSARLGSGVSVGAFAVIEAEAEIGDDCRIGAGTHVSAGVVIGAGTVVHPRAVLYPRVTLGRGCLVHSGAVIGAEGFGFTLVEGRHVKVPQIGGVEIGDDVEVGANSCIDAGTLSPTRIGDNTKIDDLVMVGHNNRIGRSVLLCGQVGLAGSNVIGDHVVLAGQTGVSGHLTIGEGAMAAAKTAVVRDVPAGEKVAGVPHMPLNVWRRVWKASQRVPDMRLEVKALQRRVDELERLVDSEGRDHGGGS